MLSSRSLRAAMMGAACVESWLVGRGVVGGRKRLLFITAPRVLTARRMVSTTTTTTTTTCSSVLSGSECEAVLEFWFLPSTRERWFASTPAFDAEVEQRWGEALGRSLGDSDDNQALDSRSLLAHVVLWDQLSRHVARVADDDSPAQLAPRAIKAARELVARDDVSKWPASHQAMALMPLRHTFDSGVILEEVIPRMEQWRKGSVKKTTSSNARDTTMDEDARVWDRFEAATLKALCRIATSTMEVLEPVSADMIDLDGWSAVLAQPLVDSTETGRILKTGFLLANGRHVTSLKAMKATKQLLLEQQQQQQDKKRPHVVLSLSGGVDSMLLLHCLALLRGTVGVRVTAVHINYANRPEATTEADFVQEWCNWLGVPLWRRDITEMSRANTPREDYEELTRQVRFEVYKRATEGDQDAVVLLGHNRNDSWENLFTNVNKGQSYENLRGMARMGSERGVSIARPLLTLSKAEIYDEAASLALPHTRSTTSPDCERGILRNEWLPLVEERQPLLVPGLERLSDHLEFLHGAWRRELSSYFDRAVEFRDIDDQTAIDLAVEQWVLEATSESLWVDVFHRIAERTERSRPTNKSLANLHGWLQRTVARARKTGDNKRASCELSRDYRAFYQPKTNTLTVQTLPRRVPDAIGRSSDSGSS